MNQSKHNWLSCALCLALILTSSCAQFDAPARDQMRWSKLPAIPDNEGFAGCFAGVSHGALIVAGGANMVGNKWGTNFHKRWYDSIFVLESPHSQWRLVGKLARPLGYGVSITTDDSLICIGGSDATTHYSDAFRITWTNNAVRAQSLPSLPKPCAYLCGAKVGQTIYVAGGLVSPNATNASKNFWSLDLSAKTPHWTELPPWPGPERMLSVAGVLRDEFYLVSGVRLKLDAQQKTVRDYLKDAYVFSPQNGWRKIADVPRASTAAPSPAISTQQLLIMSGDDGSHVDLQPSPAHPGFARDVLGYDPEKNQWSIVDAVPFSRATAPVVEWNAHVVVPMGEVRPRERTPEVWWAPLPRSAEHQRTP